MKKVLIIFCFLLGALIIASCGPYEDTVSTREIQLDTEGGSLSVEITEDYVIRKTVLTLNAPYDVRVRRFIKGQYGAEHEAPSSYIKSGESISFGYQEIKVYYSIESLDGIVIATFTTD